MCTVYIRCLRVKWDFILCFTSVWVCPAASFSCSEQEEKGHCLRWVWLRVSMENIIHRPWLGCRRAPVLLFACLCVCVCVLLGSLVAREEDSPPVPKALPRFIHLWLIRSIVIFWFMSTMSSLQFIPYIFPESSLRNTFLHFWRSSNTTGQY